MGDSTNRDRRGLSVVSLSALFRPDPSSGRFYSCVWPSRVLSLSPAKRTTNANPEIEDPLLSRTSLFGGMWDMRASLSMMVVNIVFNRTRGAG